jgi:hypothetical protein
LSASTRCRWLDESWTPAARQSTTKVRRSVSIGVPRIVRACLELIAGDSGTLWAVGRNASAGQIELFIDSCYEIARTMQQPMFAQKTDADTGTPIFICGEEPCFIDFILWPFMSRALLCLKEFNSSDAIRDSKAYIAEDHAVFDIWVSSMEQLPAVQMTAPDESSLLDAWKRTGRLDWFDYESVPVGKFHPHLVPQQ